MREIRWTKGAERDLQGIGDALLERIFAKVALLAPYPLMGPSMDGPYEGFRQLLIGPFRVIYQYEETSDIVWIAYVRHGARQLGLRLVRGDDD